ncbi:hypothetical protein JCGZ_03915 [Jatropha curcas]|uniref:Uncharacterized protein n=1 Tax=Jatropha curcas TaxID=180498 RepID=A0A067LFD4_JATCU|nr:uncharacterized protein LOC110009320 [Jatropha curcas]KDP47107.1 hypothetical protein JCGZ_03915 [Jatropha curcas]
MPTTTVTTTTTTSEDFSFPTLTGTVPAAIDSPPLWQLSPDSCHSKSTKRESNEESDQEEYFKDCFPLKDKQIKNNIGQRKSFSWVEDEEKMDMLWEDFNEDLMLKRNYSCGNSSRFSGSHDMVNMGCVPIQSLRPSVRNNGAMISAPRKPNAGFEVFMKALKRVFLLHQNHSPRIRRVKNQS